MHSPAAKANFPIGIFDSGIGGLTVLKEVLRRLPAEDLIYFGDTARVPYGNKSADTVIRYSIENSIFLMEKGIKALVIACNTVNAQAMERLEKLFHIPILGVIQPSCEVAVSTTRSKRIGVVGTRGTIASGAYQRLLSNLLPEAAVFPVSCPLFVPLVEEGFLEHAATRQVVEEYLTPFKQAQVDTLVLGCTHYPLLRSQIQAVMGREVALVDCASTCAQQLEQVLQQHQLLRPAQQQGKISFFVSDDPKQFSQLATTFLGRTVELAEVTTTRLL